VTRTSLVADIRPLARHDVDRIAATIAAEHPEAGARFLDEFDAVVDRLLQFPELARVWQTNRPDALSTVRRLVMRGFRVSIFYRPTKTTIEVLRVLHHSQDALPLLEDL
jgi:plasmid stabilization system protein ParE